MYATLSGDGSLYKPQVLFATKCSMLCSSNRLLLRTSWTETAFANRLGILAGKLLVTAKVGFYIEYT